MSTADKVVVINYKIWKVCLVKKMHYTVQYTLLVDRTTAGNYEYKISLSILKLRKYVNYIIYGNPILLNTNIVF